MSWYAFLLPVVLIALAVRLEATLIGPYWAWVEMIPFDPEEDRSRPSARRNAFLRRVAIPGVLAFALVALWPETYSLLNSAILGAAGAGLLLWPIIFHGLPWIYTGRRLVWIYLSLLGAFAASGATGAYIAMFARADDGLLHFLQENVIGIIFGGIVTLFLTGTLTSISSYASRHRDDVDAG